MERAGRLFVPGATAAVVLSFTRLHILLLFTLGYLCRALSFLVLRQPLGGGAVAGATRARANGARCLGSRVLLFVVAWSS